MELHLRFVSPLPSTPFLFGYRRLRFYLWSSCMLTVVGEQEESTRSVNVRNRDDVGQKQRNDATIPLDEMVRKLKDLKDDRRKENKLE
jgi:threonyl-tRNA synthetase